jgi:integrase
MQNSYLAQIRGVWNICWTEQKDGRSIRRTRSTGETNRSQAQIVHEGFQQHVIEISRDGQSPLMGDLLTAYSERLTRRGAAETSHICVRHLQKHLAGVRLCHLTQQRLDKYADDRGVAPPTLRREFNALKAAIHLAQKAKVISRDDIPHIEMPAQSEPRQVHLDIDERDAFIDAVAQRGPTDRLHIFVMLALFCGQRMSATINLKWSQVNFTTGLIDFRPPGQAKTNKRKGVVPMSKRLRAALETARLSATSDFVCYHNGDVRQTYARWIAGTPWSHVHIHDLRRTFVITLLMKGVAVPIVAGLVQDDPATMLRTYAPYIPSGGAEAVALLD